MKPKVVVIGGGTGTFTVLSGLKKYDLDLTAIVSMADSGGTAKIERDDFGVLPNSDIRKALLALSEMENANLLRELFSYRFYKGVGISGVTFGNLFLTALTDILGNQFEAIKYVENLLNCKGSVLPVSLMETNLLATYNDGSKVLGEHYIDEPKNNNKKRIVNLELVPQAHVFPLARQAIQKADLLVIGPGDLFTSVIANLIVEGVREAILQAGCTKVYIVNLISKMGESYKYTAYDHVKEIEEYLGKNIISHVLVNNSKIPKVTLDLYKKEGGYPVKDDLKNSYYKVIKGDFLSQITPKKERGDTLKRSLVRHDEEKLAKELISLL